MGPCELSTVVPVEEYTRLVSPGQDTCDLDGGVEFFGFVLAVNSVKKSFILPCVGTLSVGGVHVVLAVLW